jgi:hypothetical protein
VTNNKVLNVKMALAAEELLLQQVPSIQFASFLFLNFDIALDWASGSHSQCEALLAEPRNDMNNGTRSQTSPEDE